MWASALDQTDWTVDESAHLAACAECREQVDRVSLLATELQIARRSEPGVEALRRYASLFAEVQLKPVRGLREFLGALRGLLVYDSRLQAAGVRAGNAGAYSLLYETADADIELYVQAGDQARMRVEGEITASGEGGSFGAALVQLLPIGVGQKAAEVESANGRFRFEAVPPGSYRLAITPAEGRMLEIDKLELA